MIMPKTIIIFVLLANLLVPAAAGESYPLQQTVPAALSVSPLISDHYDPVMLNEFAIAKIRMGDLTTARIMLERAVQLAPHDQRIRRNLQELQAYLTGVPPALPAVQVAKPAVGKSEQPVLPEPPPIWPIR